MVKVLDTGRRPAKENMQIDEDLLTHLKEGEEPILHFYDWIEPAITYGYFVTPETLVKKIGGVDFARRPTGGGILFHIWDFAFSILIPAHHEGYSPDVLKNYCYINERLIIALTNFLEGKLSFGLLKEDPVAPFENAKHFCFAKPTIYDVMCEGKKIAGAAQRRKKNGYLHQGSISLFAPDQTVLEEILLDKDVHKAMKGETFVPFSREEERIKKDLKSALEKVFTTLL
jgi:lipoate-protein ligase A